MHTIAGRTLRLAAVLIFTLTLAPIVAFAAPGVEPSSVTQNLNPGGSYSLTKTVHTPVIPPKPDIVFLSDTTGSMGGAISNVESNIGTITSDVLSAQPDAQFAVAEYKDGDPDYCPSDPFAFKLDQGLTANASDVTNAMSANWNASGGCDTPESQINALAQVSTAVGWRAGSTRIVVWFGDEPGHDPSLGITQSDAISALQAANIEVIAINVANLDATGQATAITTATNGVLLTAASPSDVSNQILAGLHDLPVTVTPQLTSADSHLSVTWDSASQTVTSGDDATFTETITVASDAPQGSAIGATVDFLLNGASAGSAFTETISIGVNDVTAPVADCSPGTNPSGKNVPGSKANPKAGQNPDGFYLLTATDNVDPSTALEIYVADGASSFVAGPYASGTTIKLTQAPGATPSAAPGPGVVTAHITLNGDALVYAVDTSGNGSAASAVSCLVPPPAK